MRTRLLTALALLALTVGSTSAQQDARTLLQAVAKNIGADNLNTLQISGTKGWYAFPGASYSPEVDWTRFELTAYTKAIDFNAGYFREQITRGLDPMPGLAAPRAYQSRGRICWTWCSAATSHGCRQGLAGRWSGKDTWTACPSWSCGSRHSSDAARVRQGGPGARSGLDDGDDGTARPAACARVAGRHGQVPGHGNDQRTAGDRARADACGQPDVW